MRDSCKKYYISDDVLVVHDRYNKNFFAYHRLKRERIELNFVNHLKILFGF